MKIKLELPSFLWADRDPDAFDHITMLSIRFDTAIYYAKRHDTGYSEFVFTILGFGVRINWNNEKD